MAESEHDTLSPQSTADEDPIEESTLPEPEPKTKGFWSRAFRWLLVLAIIFGLGALLIMFLLFIPARDQAIQANQQIELIKEQAQADLVKAEQVNAELEETIDNLSTLEAQKEALQGELDKANLHIVILNARTDVANAQLVLVKEEDVTKARVTLSQTSETLETLEDMLEPDQRNVAADMQERLQLVLDELEDNPYAAESDLDVLARSLLELESALISNP